MFLIGFPLLLVPFAIYNIIAFLMPGVSWSSTLTTVHLASGADWTMSAGDMLIVLAVLLLFGEVMKSTRIGMRTVVDHGLSLLLFIGFIDVIGGFAVTLRAAQRDLTVEGVEHVS